MLERSAIIGFIPTRDADRARPFYEEVLGLQCVSDDGFAVVFRTGEPASGVPGTMIRLVRVGEFSPAAFTILGWEVAAIQPVAQALRERGVEALRFGFLQQDEDGIWKAPDGDQVFWFKDPDGNTLSLSRHG